MNDCPVNRTVYGNRCDGPGTYYCDSDLWGSECRRYFEQRGNDEIIEREASPYSRVAETGDPRVTHAEQQESPNPGGLGL